MPELLRSVDVTIEVDTNKKTRTKSLHLDGDETLDEFMQRIRKALEGMTEV